MSEFDKVKKECPLHANNLITHICTHKTCESCSFICSQCLIDQTNHLVSHKQHIENISEYYSQKYISLECWYDKVGKNQDFYEFEQQIDQLFIEKRHQIKQDFTYYLKEFERIILENEQHYIEQLDKFHIQIKQEIDDISNRKHIISKQQFAKILQDKTVEQSVEFFKRLQILLDQVSNNYVLTSIKNKIDDTKKSSFLNFDFKYNFQIDIDQMNLKLKSQIAKIIQVNKEPITISQNDQLIQKKLHEQILKIESPQKFEYQEFSPQKPEKSDLQYISFQNKLKQQKSMILKSSLKVKSKFLQSQKSTITQLTSKFIHEQQQQTKVQIQKISEITGFLDIQYLIENEVNKAICILKIDDETIAVAGKNSVIKIFKIQNQQFYPNIILKLIIHTTSPIWSMEIFQQHGKQILVAGTENGKIKAYDLSQILSSYSKQIDIFPIFYLNALQENQTITSMLPIQQSIFLISGNNMGQLILWNTVSQSIIQSFNLHAKQINSMVQYDDDKIAIVSNDGYLSLWDIQFDSDQLNIVCFQKINCQAEIYSVTNIQFSDYLVLSLSDKHTVLFDTVSLQFLQQFNFDNKQVLDILAISIQTMSVNTQVLMCFTKDKIYLLNLDNMEQIQQFNINEYINNIGYTYQSSYKAVITNKNYPNQIQFAVVEQNNQVNRVFVIYSLKFNFL